MQRQATGRLYDYGVVAGPNEEELRRAYNGSHPVTIRVVSDDGDEKDVSLLLRKRLGDTEGCESYEATIQNGPSDVRLDYNPTSDRHHKGGIHVYRQ